jgi:hypothetical protein
VGELFLADISVPAIVYQRRDCCFAIRSSSALADRRSQVRPSILMSRQTSGERHHEFVGRLVASDQARY